MVIAVIIIIILAVAIVVVVIFLCERWRYTAEIGPPPSRKGSMRLVRSGGGRGLEGSHQPHCKKKMSGGCSLGVVGEYVCRYEGVGLER